MGATFMIRMLKTITALLVLIGNILISFIEHIYRQISKRFFRILKHLKKHFRLLKKKVRKFKWKKFKRFFVIPKLVFATQRKFLYGIIFAALFIFTPVTVYSWYSQLPDTGLLLENGSRSSTKILDRNGLLLYEIYEDKKYNPVPLSSIPDHAIKSTLAIEDDEFYKHHGVRPLSIVRAAKATILEDELQGGSTITQQLIKNVLLSPERTVSRKIKEIVLAYLVEQKYTKDQILELYFNNIPYGGTAWGIQSASQKYFGKNVQDLNLAESSLLAALPSAPTAFSPITNPDAAKQRQRIVLDRMVDLKYIAQQEADDAFSQDLDYSPQIDYIRAPHFVWLVREQLAEKFGDRVVNYGGLIVQTTLDLNVQDQVEEIVRDQVEKSKHLSISNGAAVVLDPKTGEILAYVGSKDYFQGDWGAFDILTALRQPGSAIKPLTYALAFNSGMTPVSTIDDSAVVFKNDWETYKPVNYDGRYHGTVTLRQALANSYNIPAVKLVNKLGPDNMVELGHNFGLTNWEKDGSYGISVTLGGKEVRPLDLANVYATFARGGVYKDVTSFLSIKDTKGHEFYTGNDKEERVIKPEVAYIVTNILSDYYARLPAFGTNNFLSVKGHTIAVKTGTTDLKRDNWTIGYTPGYVVAVWVGNNDNTPMNRYLASGLSGAAPMWNRIMTLLLDGKPDESFEIPSGVFVKYEEKCNRSEVFLKGSRIPETLCPDEKAKDTNKKKG